MYDTSCPCMTSLWDTTALIVCQHAPEMASHGAQDLIDSPASKEPDPDLARRSLQMEPRMVLPSPFALAADEPGGFRTTSPGPGINSQLQHLSHSQALSGLDMAGSRSVTTPSSGLFSNNEQM